MCYIGVGVFVEWVVGGVDEYEVGDVFVCGVECVVYCVGIVWLVG